MEQDHFYIRKDLRKRLRLKQFHDNIVLVIEDNLSANEETREKGVGAV